MLDYLMDDLKMVNKSDVHKFADKHLCQQRKHAKMEWVGMNIKIDGVHEAMLKEILKKWHMKSEQYSSEKIQEDYSVAVAKRTNWIV